MAKNETEKKPRQRKVATVPQDVPTEKKIRAFDISIMVVLGILTAAVVYLAVVSHGKQELVCEVLGVDTINGLVGMACHKN